MKKSTKTGKTDSRIKEHQTIKNIKPGAVNKIVPVITVFLFLI